ncbi:MAG TPA: histidine kinase dimerization/phospho-acceptor domain-containing protein, partial [bacterium]|nr:histidine kinase dimerization/phospho-acceptor domain-containing protein [bacterium]
MPTRSNGVDIEGASREEIAKRFKAVSERAQKLEELVEIISRGKYMWESTFDAITAPVQIVSRDYDILRANLTLASVCKKDIAVIIGRKCYEAFAGRKKPCEGCPLSAALSGDSPVRADLGSAIGGREFEANAYPLGGAGSDSAVISYRDVTEERRLQREVIQQEKMAAIGMLAGGVAHEINNPLGGILAFTQLMKRDALGNEALTSDLDEVEKAAIRCKKIVADLLDFSRVSKDRERRLFDVNAMIEKVFPFVQRELRSLNIELVFDGAAGLPNIVGIPDRLQQVFLNLITNAIHAMPKGGRLEVSTRVFGQEKRVEVLVRDTGPGIPKEIRERIFDPFFTTKEP